MGRRCGGGSQQGSRQLSWAQALSSNLFTCSSLLSPPFDTLPVQIPLRAASHALSCPRFPSLSSLPSPPRWLLLALSHLFISAHHFSSLQLISLRLHSLFFILFFRSITGLTSLRSTLRSAPPPVGSVLTKCLPVRRLSPWARADSLQSFSSSWLRLPWQQATGRNTPHIVFPRQQSHHLEQIDELPWSGRAGGNNCCILYLSHVKS